MSKEYDAAQEDKVFQRFMAGMIGAPFIGKDPQTGAILTGVTYKGVHYVKSMGFPPTPPTSPEPSPH